MVQPAHIANDHRRGLPQHRGLFMSDDETIQVYNDRVDQYVNCFAPGEADPDLEAFIDMMPHAARVLDLGCGPAMASVFMRAAGLNPDPVDASVEMVRIANETHDINARVAQFTDVQDVAQYDGVWANFSLLHAPRDAMPTHLSALNTALKPDGVLHLGLKLGQGEERDKIGRFYTYYTEVELNDLLSGAGFTIAHTRQDSGMGMAGTDDPFIIIRATKD